jgi:hypothetical protein
MGARLRFGLFRVVRRRLLNRLRPLDGGAWRINTILMPAARKTSRTVARPSFEELSKPAQALAETAARNADGVAWVDTAEQRAAANDLESKRWGTVRHHNDASGSLCWFEHSAMGARV